MLSVGMNNQSPQLSDDTLLTALHDGDERVFADLVERWSGAMLRLALAHVQSRAVAEEVVQEAWLIVLRDLDRFEGRSALRTWVLGIVVNVARARARAERRAIPVGAEPGAPVVDPARFVPPTDPSWADHWSLGPVAVLAAAVDLQPGTGGGVARG